MISWGGEFFLQSHIGKKDHHVPHDHYLHSHHDDDDDDLPIKMGSFQSAGLQILVCRSRLWSEPELQYGWFTNSTLIKDHGHHEDQ